MPIRLQALLAPKDPYAPAALNEQTLCEVHADSRGKQPLLCCTFQLQGLYKFSPT